MSSVQYLPSAAPLLRLSFVAVYSGENRSDDNQHAQRKHDGQPCGGSPRGRPEAAGQPRSSSTSRPQLEICEAGLQYVDGLRGHMLYPVAFIGAARSGKSHLANELVRRLATVPACGSRAPLGQPSAPAPSHASASAAAPSLLKQELQDGSQRPVPRPFVTSSACDTACTSGIDIYAVPRRVGGTGGVTAAENGGDPSTCQLTSQHVAAPARTPSIAASSLPSLRQPASAATPAPIIGSQCESGGTGSDAEAAGAANAVDADGHGAFSDADQQCSSTDGYWLIIDAPGTDLDDASDAGALCLAAVCTLLSRVLVYVDVERLSLHGLAGLARTVAAYLQLRSITSYNHAPASSAPALNQQKHDRSNANGTPFALVAVNKMTLSMPANPVEWLDKLLSHARGTESGSNDANELRRTVEAALPAAARTCICIPYSSTVTCDADAAADDDDDEEARQPQQTGGESARGDPPPHGDSRYDRALSAFFSAIESAAMTRPAMDTSNTPLDGAGFKVVLQALVRSINEWLSSPCCDAGTGVGIRSIAEFLSGSTASIPTLADIYSDHRRRAYSRAVEEYAALAPAISGITGEEEDRQLWRAHQAAATAASRVFDTCSADLLHLYRTTPSLRPIHSEWSAKFATELNSHGTALLERCMSLREVVRVDTATFSRWSPLPAPTSKLRAVDAMGAFRALQPREGGDSISIPVNDAQNHQGDDVDRPLIVAICPTPATLAWDGAEAALSGSSSSTWPTSWLPLVRPAWRLYDCCAMQYTYSHRVAIQRNGKQKSGDALLSSIQLVAAGRFERRWRQVTWLGSILAGAAVSVAVGAVVSTSLRSERTTPMLRGANRGYMTQLRGLSKDMLAAAAGLLTGCCAAFGAQVVVRLPTTTDGVRGPARGNVHAVLYQDPTLPADPT